MGGKGSGNRTASNPLSARRAENVDQDGNSRRIAYLNAVRRLPDVDMSSEEEVEARIDLFFEMCDEYGMHPLVGNLAANFGMSRQYFMQVVNGEKPANNRGVNQITRLALKKAYAFIDVNYEQTLTSAKNPVPWIFLGKATLNWKEQNETIVTHKSDTPRLSEGSADEVRARYAELLGVEDANGSGVVYELPEASDSDS